MKLELSIDHDRNTPREVYRIVQRNLRMQAREIEQECTKEEIGKMVTQRAGER